MRNLLYLLLFALLFTACDKDETKEPKDTWNSFVSINPDASFQLKSLVPGLTPENIVRDAYSMNVKTHWLSNGFQEEPGGFNRGFPDHVKDFDNNILKFYATDIITEDGILLNSFLKAYDVFILNEANDTIAYIPNEVLRAAEPLIEAAFEDGDYNEVYRLFDEAYTYKAID